MVEILARGGLPPHLQARLAGAFTLHRHGAMPPADWLSAHGARVRGMVTTAHEPLGAELLDRLPALEIVSSLGVGYDNIDVAAAVARGVVVTHTPDVLNADVANHALLLLLAASRDLVALDAHARSERWLDGPYPLAHSIEGRPIGILGLGRIGREIARRLAIFGGPILYHGRRRQDVPYEYCPDLVEMAARVHALILALPGGAGTRHIVGCEVLDALGPEGILVNIARGSVVDETALGAALTEGRLGFAALDVFEDEPRIPDALRASPRTILSPHAGSATHETRRAMFDLTADNLIRYFETGAPLTPVPECRAS